MAVVLCPDCKKEISDTAKVCPNCGYPYGKNLTLYTTAKSLMESCSTSTEYLGAAELFHSICGLLDAEELEKICRERAETCQQQEIQREQERQEQEIRRKQEEEERRRRELQELEEKKEQEEEERERRRKEFVAAIKQKKNQIILAVTIVVLLLAGGMIFVKVGLPSINYTRAASLMNEGEYEEALSIFQSLSGYKDSSSLVNECQYLQAKDYLEAKQYQSAAPILEGLSLLGYKDSRDLLEECQKGIEYISAENLLNDGREAEAALAFSKISDYEDSFSRSLEAWDAARKSEVISAGTHVALGLKEDGTVLAIGSAETNAGQCDVSAWTNIASVSAGLCHSVGLKEDGTVVATGLNTDGQCNVGEWRDIIEIHAGFYHTVGLKSDHTVVATICSEETDYGQCNVSWWKNIVAVAAGRYHTVGLKADGTVVAVGSNDNSQCDVEEWTDIVAIDAGVNYTAGLRSDGSVVTTGFTRYFNKDSGVHQYSLSLAVSTINWTAAKFIAISVGDCIIGLKENGRIEDAGVLGDLGQDWENIIDISAGIGYSIKLHTTGEVEIVTHEYMTSHGYENCYPDYDIDTSYIPENLNWKNIKRTR